MGKKIFLLTNSFLFVFALFYLKQTKAITLNLSPDQIKEAIQYGKQNKSVDFVTFSGSWTVALGKGKGFATLFTPYHNIAYKAKKFEIEHRELSNRDILNALEIGNSLVFTVTVYGDVFNFAVFQTAKLCQKDLEIKPIYEFKPDIADASEFWPNPPSQMARMVFRFPVYDIDLNAPATLVVFDPEGDEGVSFPFDLTKMK
ncbi:MAG: hypothetical protein E3K37_13950 [Candidatus Kuenenia sp.]|nr:hypothetical protein [Candidatus Kuenenia hertensis]